MSIREPPDRRPGKAGNSACDPQSPWREAMRFLSMVKVNESAGKKPSQQLMDDMGRLMEEMFRTGKLVDTAGLKPTSESVRVELKQGGKISVVDGPFAEGKEVVGGYAVLEAESKDEAIELTRRFLQVHGTDWDIACEVREIAGPGDC
jgi:hypothetical protein